MNRVEEASTSSQAALNLNMSAALNMSNEGALSGEPAVGRLDTCRISFVPGPLPFITPLAVHNTPAERFLIQSSTRRTGHIRSVHADYRSQPPALSRDS